MIDASLDHVAIAVRNIAAAIPFYTDVLGATFVFAGEEPGPGFRWAQFRFPGGGKVELVTPMRAGSFLDRFLERHGEGVHHVTLKVPDIARALAHLDEMKVPTTNLSLESPEWKEAFVHPKDANGTLIQIAQSSLSDDEMALRHVHPEHGSDGHRHLGLEELLAAVRDAPDEPAAR